MQAPTEIRALPPWAGEEAAASSLPPHYVFRDNNGEIVVSYPYPENPGRRITHRFWLPNRVEPRATTSVTLSEQSGQPSYLYGYTLRNDATAESAIVQWSIVGPPNEDLTIAHPLWKHYNARVPVAPQALLPDAPMGAFVVWLAVGVSPVSAGIELKDFTLRSKFSPGLTTAYAQGEGVLEEPGPGEFPEAVVQELIPLQRPGVWQKPFLTIGPRFAPATPFRAILETFRKDIASLIQQGLLSSESPYVRELQGILNSGGTSSNAVLDRKVSPRTQAERDLDTALRMSTIATR